MTKNMTRITCINPEKLITDVDQDSDLKIEAEDICIYLSNPEQVKTLQAACLAFLTIERTATNVNA